MKSIPLQNENTIEIVIIIGKTTQIKIKDMLDYINPTCSP
jgi:hypothetical protein